MFGGAGSGSGADNVNTSKRKRRPAGTPDPEAEVVWLSPQTLMESDRYVCEICNQGFQREQNLQMHRRRHKVPWKLLKRPEGESEELRKRVFVCPEPNCLHHDPRHALGDLVGIKKHFRRKHSNFKQWSCTKCSKAYAVHSDYKAHLKTCGTRGHSCDCGRVFSRVESFIEHQNVCSAGRPRPVELPVAQPVCLSASSPSPSSDNNICIPAWLSGLRLRQPTSLFHPPDQNPSPISDYCHATQNIELQLLPVSHVRASSPLPPTTIRPASDEVDVTKLQLSVGDTGSVSARVKEEAREQFRLAEVDEARADDARQLAKQQRELAQQEFANAKRMRQQSHTELCRALAMRDYAVKKINAVVLEISCQACKQSFQATSADENSLAVMSSAGPKASEDHLLAHDYNSG